MKKLAWSSAIVAVLLLAYTAAGPFLTINAIRAAVQAEDSRALSKQVDFPALRQSLRLQLADAMVRGAGADVQSSLLGAIGLQLAGSAVGSGVDLMVNPVGLSALMRGRRIWNLSTGAPLLDDGGDATQTDLLADARYRYHSPSRFTATVRDDRGRPIVFVLTRKGIGWKLSDIRLPT
ncbi:DUF2939 domain-containing protein [Luteimonas sp. BDR2-5]|uniref:DUF2939 domain-containing protein n=1 Tax=Proluteimonas luteida TaxID=2878685 RepID=UPI001E4095A4|nr:DUF2939 domain-containing protein [Luteimonas sp. BDR2-5]MCD9027638.1 DUF2939 domain-containing protein [Luteimonas sp. BDR2-5]